MTKKTIGFTKLQWTCPNCGTKNPGPRKTCTSCGFAQPDDVKFEQLVESEIITDEAELKQAKAGADIYCFYCGTRNPADATNCSQCGGDLTQGTARQSGKVVGAFQKGEIKFIPCPSCGAMLHPDAPACPRCGAILKKPETKTPPPPPPKKPMNKLVLFGILGAILLGAIFCGTLLFSTDETSAKVERVEWQRSINIEALAPVERETWKSDLPADAVIGTCTQKVEHIQDDPAPNAKEICGTPYTVDEGNGFGKVQQDCQYEVYADWCKYTVEEWTQADAVVASGQDLNPYDPQLPALNAKEREGTHSETYTIYFNADGEAHTYETNDYDLFRQAEIGSRWILTINKLGGIVSIEKKK